MREVVRQMSISRVTTSRLNAPSDLCHLESSIKLNHQNKLDNSLQPLFMLSSIVSRYLASGRFQSNFTGCAKDAI